MSRRKGKNIALVLVYTFVLFLLASVLFSIESLKEEAKMILQDAPEMTVQRLIAGRQDLIPVSYIEPIRAIRGVQAVEPRLWGYYFDALSGANYTLMVNPALNNNTGEMVIGRGVARRSEAEGRQRTLGKNDVIPFKTSDGSVLTLTVKGLLPAASELVTADLILVAENDFRRIFAIEEQQATDLVLTVKNPKELNTIAVKITQLLPDTRPIVREDILRTYDAVFDWRSGVTMMVLAGVLFAFGILALGQGNGPQCRRKERDRHS
jgi:hypothetical protein